MASTGIRECIRHVSFYLIFLIFISTLGPLQFGFHLAELNAPQDVITCKQKALAEELASKPDARLPQCIPMSEAQFAMLSSMYVLGGFAGALSAGPISTSHGRLLSMRLTSFFFLLGSTLEALAGTLPVMSVGRALAGVGAGASTVVVPLFISEVAPPKERGLFGSMTQITINIGILMAQTLGYFLSKGAMWRIILAVGIGIGFVQGLGLCFVPESPAWLAAHKDPREALQTLQRIRGANVPLDGEIEHWDFSKASAEEEEESLLVEPQTPTRRSSIASRASRKSNAHIGFFQAFSDPLYRPAIIAVIGIMFAQQFCGINSIMMYSVSLLSGLLPITSSLLTILISLVNLVTTISCAPLPDKIGRKGSLLLSITGMGTMSLCLALSLLWETKIFSAITVVLFVAFFATGLGPVPFMMASELVGQEAVGATQSWALAANYIATFLVAQFFPILNSWLNGWLGGKGWVYFIFAALTALSGVFVIWRVPETRGKRDADEVWGRTIRND